MQNDDQRDVAAELALPPPGPAVTALMAEPQSDIDHEAETDQIEAEADRASVAESAVDGDDGTEAGIVADLHARLGAFVTVEPDTCRPFPGAPRAGAEFDAARDGDLLDSIRAHGVLEPIILYDYDGRRCVLAGNRRLAVVRQLRSQGFDVALPARLADFTDLEAVAFAHAQNEGQVMPTAMEQALGVKWTLETLEANQAVLANAMGVSENKVSRLALLASLPDWVTAIVTDPAKLSENFAGELQGALNKPRTWAEMKKRADMLVKKNVTLAGPAAVRYLLTGQRDAEAVELLDRQKTRHATMTSNSRGGVVVRLSPGFRTKGADVDAIHALVSQALLDHMRKHARRPD